MPIERRALLSAAAAPLLAGQKSVTPATAAYEIWDVFTGERFAGNPLAVFLNASLLPEAQLGAIAREMAHSETTFVFPNGSPGTKGIRTRIFSRAGVEMPFAGHPVLGTAFALFAKKQSQQLILSLPAGLIPVAFTHRSDGSWEGEMVQPEPIFAERHPPSELLPILGLKAEDLDSDFPLENVSTGRPNVIVMLKSREAVRRAAIDWRSLDAYFASGDRERGIYLLTRDVERPQAQFHARKPTRVGDDPVTGSAAGSAIAALVNTKLVPPGKRIIIEQGSEVKRRGELFVSADLANGRVTHVVVGGQAVCSARGSLVL